LWQLTSTEPFSADKLLTIGAKIFDLHQWRVCLLVHDDISAPPAKAGIEQIDDVARKEHYRLLRGGLPPVEVGDATVAFWMVLDAALIGLLIDWRRWLRQVRPAQNSEHARENDHGKEVAHGKRKN